MITDPIEQALRAMMPYPLIRDGSHWVSDEPKAPTAAEIITMTEQSDMADQFAKWICEKAGITFPPTLEKS